MATRVKGYEFDLLQSITHGVAFFIHCREIDAFVEHLKETIKFFDKLSPGGEKQEDSEEDDFVPFI